MFSILIPFLLQICTNHLRFFTLTSHMKLGFHQPRNNYYFTNNFLYSIFFSNSNFYYLLIFFLCLLLFFFPFSIKKMWRRFLCAFPGKSIKPYRKISNSKKSSPSSSSSKSDSGSYDSSSLGNSNPTVSSWDQLEISDSEDAGFVIDPLVPFKDANILSDNEKRKTLFISKLCLCGSIVIDFKKQSNMKTIRYEKDLKKIILLELRDFVSSNSITTYSESEILAVCRMCSANLFRDFPPPSNSLLGYDHVDRDLDDRQDVREHRYDPAWTHLKIVYDVLLSFVTSSSLDAKVAKKYINYNFLLGLFELFDSEDPRERECLKILLHRIYGKFVVYRPFIRKNISYIFYEYTFGNVKRHNGITELLEILGSVIAGFAIPLKTEFKVLLCRVLIPMHKPKTLGLYIQQLTNCMVQYITKEPKLGSRIISGMLKFWPKTSSRKEVMFLTELEDILEAIEMAEFQKVMFPLFQRLGCCISSYSFQVAERTMLLWNNDKFVSLVEGNRHVILPMIFPALEHNIRYHWNQAVLNLTFDVRNIFLHMDIPFFNACQARYVKDEQTLTIKNKREENSAAAMKEKVVRLTPLRNPVLC